MLARLHRRTPLSAIRFLHHPTFPRSNHYPSPESTPEAPKSTKDRFSSTVSGGPLPPPKRKHRKRTYHDPEEVREIFKSFSIPETSFNTVVSKRRGVLCQHPENALKPKLEFLCSLGYTGAIIGEIVASNPGILESSLELKIIPSVNFLKEFVPNALSGLRIDILKRPGRLITPELRPNFDLLKKFGMSRYAILKLLSRHPHLIFLPTARLNSILERLKGRGFDVNKVLFVEAICVFSSVPEAKLLQKVEAFKSLGWTEDEAFMVLLKPPPCFGFSEKTLKKKIGFLRDYLGWDSSFVSKCPSLLMYSIEKRFKPRGAVLNLLMLNGSITRSYGLYRFMISEKEFIRKYVTKYYGRVPEIADAYHGKRVFEGWEHGCAEKRG